VVAGPASAAIGCGRSRGTGPDRAAGRIRPRHRCAQIITQTRGTGNSVQKQLARIVHGTGRAPQLASGETDSTFRAIDKPGHDGMRVS
jgi:hypothetical protein